MQPTPSPRERAGSEDEEAVSGLTRRINRGRGHSYELDGERVAGVTTILSEGFPKPALIDWAARTVAEYVAERLDVDVDDGHVGADTLVDALRTLGRGNRYNRWPADGTVSRLALIETLKGAHREDRDAAARRGTEVHRLASELVAGLEVDVPSELAGHVDSYIRFLDAWHVAPVLVEAVVINRAHHWMGTLDLVADLADGLRWLLDIKTTRTGVYPESALQLAAYRNAEHYLDDNGTEQPMPKVDRVGAVWVRADGYDLIEVDAGPDTYRTFRHVQRIARFRTDDGDPVIGEALQPPTRQEQPLTEPEQRSGDVG